VGYVKTWSFALRRHVSHGSHHAISASAELLVRTCQRRAYCCWCVYWL